MPTLLVHNVGPGCSRSRLRFNAPHQILKSHFHSVFMPRSRSQSEIFLLPDILAGWRVEKMLGGFKQSRVRIIDTPGKKCRVSGKGCLQQIP
jgi:hypothetical protein